MVSKRYSDLPRFNAAIVVASGPSLVAEDVHKALAWRACNRDRSVIVVNTSYKAAPAADMLYVGDYAWFERYAIDAARHFLGDVWTGSRAAAERWPLVHLVKRVNGDVLPDDGICVGGRMNNSGIQAIFFAALCGATKIGLLGFDGGPVNGKTHWHAPHPEPLRPCFAHEKWPEMFDRAALQLTKRGAAVTNCSRETRLTSFERRSLDTWIS